MTDGSPVTVEKAESLKAMYDEELLGHCSGDLPDRIGWKEFKEYAEAKEVGELKLVSSDKVFCY